MVITVVLREKWLTEQLKMQNKSYYYVGDIICICGYLLWMQIRLGVVFTHFPWLCTGLHYINKRLLCLFYWCHNELLLALSASWAISCPLVFLSEFLWVSVVLYVVDCPYCPYGPMKFIILCCQWPATTFMTPRIKYVHMINKWINNDDKNTMSSFP